MSAENTLDRRLVIQDGDLDVDAVDAKVIFYGDFRPVFRLDCLPVISWDERVILYEELKMNDFGAIVLEKKMQCLEAMERQGVDRSKAILQKRGSRTATRQRRLAAKTCVPRAEHGSDRQTVADRGNTILQKRRQRTAHR